MNKQFTNKILPLIGPQGGWVWDADTDEIRPGGPATPELNSPWSVKKLDFDCYSWNRIYFYVLAQQQSVHTHCHTCYKVVIAPRNFTELWNLEQYQLVCPYRCKCGIEVRETTARRYGGYFYTWEPGDLTPYNDGTGEMYVTQDEALKGGLRRLKAIRQAAEEFVWDRENYDMPPVVILKKGCTEFEGSLGNTNARRYNMITQEQLQDEVDLAHVTRNLDRSMFTVPQSSMVRAGLHYQWYQWAHSGGDMSYLKHNDGKLMLPPTVVYEDTSVHSVVFPWELENAAKTTAPTPDRTAAAQSAQDGFFGLPAPVAPSRHSDDDGQVSEEEE